MSEHQDEGKVFEGKQESHITREEELLKASEAKYRTIFNSVNDAIFVHDPDTGAILEVNRKMTELYGYTAEEARTITVEDISLGTSPYDQKGATEKIRIASEKGELIFEWVAKNKHGRIFWAEVNLKPTLVNDKMSIIAVVRDITERKQTEDKLHKLNEELERKVHDRTVALSRAAAKLKEQKELLQTIIDHIPVIITLWKPYRKLVMVNKEFERLSGWYQEEALNMDIVAACFPDPVYRREIIRQVTTAEPGWGEFVMTDRSGKRLTISWAAVDLSDGSRIGIGIDVTERKKMEKNLLRLAAAVEQTSEGIDMTSPEGTIEYVNPALESITGYSREELVGKNVASLPGYMAGNEEQEILSHVVQEAKPWSGRQVRKKKTGEIIDVEVTISPVRDETGRIIDTVSATRDVTQEIKMQRQLVQNQKMEAIGSLAGGIAHDLKNILTPILLNTEIALEDVGSYHPARPVLEEVLDAAKLGRDLVQQVLTFSRSIPQKKVPVNISNVIRETLAFLRATLPATINIRNELDDECVMASADPTQLKQVLINLGSNAAHAMSSHGGVLDVRESSIDLDAQAVSEICPELAPGPYIQVTVQDTGEGMDEQTMEHIFEPFFTTKKGEGTGMGLAVAHGIMQNHRGAITVRSKPGEGSTFSVFLPMLRKSKEKCETPHAS